MIADVLSDVLKTVRLTGATFFDVAASDPWVAESPPCELILPRILPGAKHLIAYHVVVEGQCYANIIGEKPFPLKAGEVVVFTRADPHVLSSEPGMRADPKAPPRVDLTANSQLPFVLNFSGGKPSTAKLVCGYLACDALPFNPLLETLPPVITAGDDGETRWLGEFIRLAARETADKRPGGESVLAKLSELMFVEVVRRYLQSLPEDQAGWLAGLRDPFVGKALSLMHAEPARNWTIEELGKAVGLSRSVLAERFSDLLGMPPMLYLARWRMQVAAGLLSNGNTNIATVAAETGYGSEAAFSRAFKKVVGVPPSSLRRRGG